MLWHVFHINIEPRKFYFWAYYCGYLELEGIIFLYNLLADFIPCLLTFNVHCCYQHNTSKHFTFMFLCTKKSNQLNLQKSLFCQQPVELLSANFECQLKLWWCIMYVALMDSCTTSMPTHNVANNDVTSNYSRNASSGVNNSSFMVTALDIYYNNTVPEENRKSIKLKIKTNSSCTPTAHSSPKLSQ